MTRIESLFGRSRAVKQTIVLEFLRKKGVASFEQIHELLNGLLLIKYPTHTLNITHALEENSLIQRANENAMNEKYALMCEEYALTRQGVVQAEANRALIMSLFS